ncbi:MAG: hypothetical protein PHO67_08020 [Candidatus Omnitrophica bacterium]|nr:hypothetical protein [Candidatus Omnitrophota bacterium]
MRLLKLRRKLGEFMFPNLTNMVKTHDEMTKLQEQLQSLLSEIEKAKREIQASGKDIIIKGPVVFLGSIAACQVKLQPEIHQKFVLGQVDLQSLLSMNGSHQTVTNSVFENDSKKTASVEVFMKEKKIDA